MIVKHLEIEFIKYLITSVVSLAVDMAVYLVLGKLMHNYLISASIGYIAGLFVNYILSIKWVFSYRKIKKYHIEFGIFAIIGFGGLLVNEAVIYAGLFWLIIGPFWAKMTAAVFSFVFNFGARKLLLYTKWKKYDRIF
ncbi:MAG: GtrA family protein [Desulfurella sp.]|nr:polysaccharide synthesis protein GtrA [Desulfurella acetivorans A63]